VGLPRRLGAPTALGRARVVALVVATLGTLPHLFALASDPPRWRIAGVVALSLLVADFYLTFARRRPLLIDPVLVAVLLVVGTRSLVDPDGVIGLCLSVMVTQSMYGSTRQAYVRVLLLVAVFPLTVAFSPAAAARGLLWYSPQTWGLLPFLGMMGVLNIWLRTALVRLQQAAARDGVLAAAGQQLISQTDPGEVRRIAEAALEAACADLPGQAVLVAQLRGGTAVVVLAVDAAARDAVLPGGVVAAADGAPEPVRLEPDAGALLDRVVGGTRPWWAAGLGGGRYLLVGGSRPDGSLVDTVRTLTVQQSMAEARCRTHAELDRRAHSDELTGLPNRRALFERLAGTHDGTLLLIDLDDFKAVNDGFGHAAGDELLIQVAARIAAAAGDAGLAARLGGDEFALLRTDLDAPAAEQLARRLCQHICQPVGVAGTTVHVGASIGIVTAAAARTAGDMMRFADIAMYAAKAKGKNRVERFGPEHHDRLGLLELRK
jgi:diguanylate cyclase (GGDEF)-like protein